MSQITCEDCKHWIPKGEHYGKCVLPGLIHRLVTPGDATCEYAEEEDNDDEG